MFAISCLQGTCEVIVDVTDVNDNSPQLKDHTYWGTVPENVIDGRVIRVVSRAVQPDQSQEITSSLMFNGVFVNQRSCSYSVLFELRVSKGTI